MDAGQDRACIDHVAHIAGTEGIQDLSTSLTGLTADPVSDSGSFQIFPCQCSCLDVKAHVIKAFDQRNRFQLVLIRDADENCPVTSQLHTPEAIIALYIAL